MADQVVGKAVYQTEVDPAGVDQGLAATDQKVEQSATKAEQSFSKAGAGASTMGKAVQAAGALGAVGFGLMAKAGAEAQDVQGGFIAATGKSRAEAVAFTADMNGLRGTSAATGKSLAEIGAAGTQVAQQLGLTGKAGAAATEQFLAFSRVTGQDAAGAVDNISGALDAFGEPAERAGSLMDQLVASNQKYGTDVGPAAAQALSNMAPALQAMGKGLDYGVGLLNLFESANIDASVGQKALNKAVSELPPGENFDSIIAKLGALEDPLARRTEAAKIFGDTLGTKLANAIKPGMTSLDDFEVSTSDVAGAALTASSNMDSAADKAQQWQDKASAAFDALGQKVGPFVSGMGAIVGAVTSLSPELSGKIAGLWDDVVKSGPVQSAVSGAARAVGPIYQKGLDLLGSIQGGLSDAWAGAKNVALDAISNAGIAAKSAYSKALDIAQQVKFGLQDAWSAAKGLAGDVISAAGKAAGAAYGVALNAGQAVVDGVRGAWDLLSDLARSGLRTVVEGAGKVAGLAYAGAAFVIDRLVDAANVAWGFLEGAAEGAAKKAGGVLGKLFGEGASDSIAQTVTGAAGTIVGNLTGDLVKAVTTSWDNVKAFLQRGATGRVIAAAGAASGAIYAGAVAVTETLVSALQGAWRAIASKLAAVATAAGLAGGTAYGEGAAAGQGLENALSSAWQKVSSKSSGLLSSIGGVGSIVGAAFGLAAVAAAVFTILEHRDEIANAFKPVGDAVDSLFGDKTQADWLRDLKGAATKIQAQFGGDINDIRTKMRDAFNQAIEAGLDPETAYDYAVALGKDIGTGSASSMADSFAQYLTAHGLQVPSSVADKAGTEAGTTAGESAGFATSDAMLQSFISAGVPEDIARYLVANASTVDAAGKQMVDPTKKDLVDWATQLGVLVGGGVPEGIATQMLAGSGQLTDAVQAMLMGIKLDPTSAGLAALYEKLNVPQQTALGWAISGPFDLSAALNQVLSDTAGKIDPALAQSVMQQAFSGGLITQQQFDAWQAEIAKRATEVGGTIPPAVADGVMTKAEYLTKLGTDMAGILSDGLNSKPAQMSLKDATSQLQQLIQAGLDPTKANKADALFAIGKKYMTQVQKGLESEDANTVAAARAVAIHGINAIEDAGLKGAKGQKGLDRIGQLYFQLLQTGMSAEDARTALVAGGVANGVVDELEDWYPDFTTTGEQFSKHVATGISNKESTATGAAGDVGDAITGLPWGTWGSNSGDAWVHGMKSSIGSVAWSSWLRKNVPDFEANSPPRVGYLKDIGKWGYRTGAFWAQSLMDGAAEAHVPETVAAQFARIMQPALQRTLGMVQPALAANTRLEVRHVVALDLANAPAGISAEQVAGLVQVPLEWDAQWQQKMDEAQASTGMRWVVPVRPQ